MLQPYKLYSLVNKYLTQKTILFCVKLIIAAILTYIIVKRLDIKKFADLFLNVKIYYLIPVLLINNMDRFFMAFKWRILIKAKHLSCPLISLVRGYYFSAVLGNFLPSTIGEDFIRAYSISGNNISSENLISSIIIERILGTISLIFLSVITLGAYVRYSDKSSFGDFLFYLIVILALLGAGFIISFNKKIIDVIGYKVRSGGGRLIRFLKKLYLSYADYHTHKRVLSAFFVLSLIEHCFAIFSIYFIAKSLGMNIIFISMFYTIPTILLITRLPISIGKLGVQEGAFIALFALVGLSTTEAVTVSIMSRIVTMISLLPVFILFIFKIPIPRVLKKA